jgi:tetratricopeptide (TPR) repeat protein
MHRVGALPLVAGLLVLTVLSYLPVRHNGYVDFDDESYITTNPHVLQGLSGAGFAWAWTNLHAGYWQPLTWLSLQFDAHFFSTQPLLGPSIPSPTAVHLHNLLWHAASVLLLFGLWQRLTGARWRSFLVAALFAVHPMHVESVAWAVERKDVLSVFFGILTLFAYVRYLEKPGWARYLALMAAYSASLLSKPMLVTLPFVLLLLDYWPLRRLWPEKAPPAVGPPWTPASFGRLLLEKGPLFLLATGVGIVTAVAQHQRGVAIPFALIPLSARLANAVTAYGWYVRATFWPARLAVLYPHPYQNWSAMAALAGSALLLGVSALAFWQVRRRPWLIVGWLWFVGTLLPVIGLVQGGVQAWADRFSYWPHIGLFVALAWGLGELADRLRIPALAWGVGGAVVLGCLGALTWVQIGHWRSTETLWQRAAVTADNHRAHLNLGRYYLERGQFDRAESHFGETVRLAPDTALHHYSLGVAQLSLGKAEEAAEQFREALRQNPKDPDAWHNLAVARLRQEMPAKAIRSFRQALSLRPESTDTLAGLGMALWRAGKRGEAFRTFRTALRKNPQEAEAWRGLGLGHLAGGRPAEAVEAVSRAVRCNRRLVSAYSELGVALGRRGWWGQAVQAHRTAVRLQEGIETILKGMNGRPPMVESVPQLVLFRCRLAFALHQGGDRPGADEVYRTALEGDPNWPRKFTARAWKLATDPDPDCRDAHLACELAQQAVQAVDEPSAAMLDALAVSQAALGRFPEAVRTAQAALKRASGRNESALAAAIRGRLERYQQGRPVTARRP